MPNIEQDYAFVFASVKSITMKIAIALALMLTWSIVTETREEMGFMELYRKTEAICNKGGDALWEAVIRCHDPIDDIVSQLNYHVNFV